jgi:putative toxin-antitoxin system antitoxin component (TIGR02293 family)
MTLKGRTMAPVLTKSIARVPSVAPAEVMLVYERSQGVDAYLQRVHDATPMQIVEIERQGVAGAFITDLSQRMDLPSSRLYAMLRVPKATAARKAAEGSVVDGRAGQAAIGMVKLLGIAQDIVRNSTAEAARDFDAVKWLGQWIERPQPALGGRKPADLLDTPTGIEMVARLLGSIQSGAYQ